MSLIKTSARRSSRYSAHIAQRRKASSGNLVTIEKNTTVEYNGIFGRFKKHVQFFKSISKATVWDFLTEFSHELLVLTLCMILKSILHHNMDRILSFCERGLH